jgi:uncharacterized protein (TIRG00374 family)
MPAGLDRKTLLKTAAGFLVAAVLLYLFGWALGWAEILAVLERASLGWVVVACASTATCLVLWAKGWDIVLRVVGVDIPLSHLVPTYYAATFGDYVTPFGKAGGGPLVAYVLSTHDRATYEEAFASVFTTDSLNLLPFFSFAGVGVVALASNGEVPAAIRPAVLLLGGMAVALPVLGWVLWQKEAWLVRTVSRVGAWVGERTAFVDAGTVEARTVEFFSHLDRVATSRKRLLEVVTLSYGGWLLFAAPMWFAGQALGVELDLWLVAFVVPASTLASFVPTPGGLGGVEAAVAGLLVALAGLPVPLAAGIALLYRVASYWFVLVTGGVAAFWVVYQG